MIEQGWPLWACRGTAVYAVIGWVDRRVLHGDLPNLRPVGVELGVPLDGAPAVVLGDDLTFTTKDPTA